MTGHVKDTAGSLSASNTTTATVSSTGGNILVASVGGYILSNTPLALTSVTDSAGNTWTYTTTPNTQSPPNGSGYNGGGSGATSFSAIAVCLAGPGGLPSAVTSVTFNFNASLSGGHWDISEFSGVPAGAQIAGASSNTYSTAEPYVTPSVVSPFASGVIVAGANTLNGANAVAGPFTMADDNTATAWYIAGPGTYSASLTLNSATDTYAAVILALGYLPQGAAAPPPPLLVPPGPFSPMAFSALPVVPPTPAPQPVSGTDTGTGADTGSVAASLSDTDTGTGADTATLAAALSDADTGTGADTGSVAVAVSGTDTGTGADSGSLPVASTPPPPLTPPGFTSPMAFAAFPPPRPSSLAAAAVSDTDTGTGADTGSVATALSDADTGTGADTGSVAVAVSGSDTAAGADTGSAAVAVSGTDTGTGADTGSVAVAVSGTDTGTGADSGSVTVSQAPPPPSLIPPGPFSPMAFSALPQPVPVRAAAPAASTRGAAFLVFFP